MAGLYIHIPFCKSACHYCDFHFSTSLQNKGNLIKALCKELELQKNYLNNEPLSSIYFGGGTPSILETEEIAQIFDAIAKNYNIVTNAEVTLEANPDDLNIEKLKQLKANGINRLSIGIQSFDDDFLKWMNRAHNSEMAISSVKEAQQLGFDNISIDLIYGLPHLTQEHWEKTMEMAFDLKIQHLSCYCLTLEPRTYLAHLQKKGLLTSVDEVAIEQQFEQLRAMSTKMGFEHYEISNFSLPGMASMHNSNYWLKESYLGIGPSAHSYNGVSRQWNVRNNPQYIHSIELGKVPFEMEMLGPKENYNEYILTSLRTKWGCDLNKVKSIGLGFYIHCLEAAEVHIKSQLLERNEMNLKITAKGLLLADGRASDLFWVD